jgi:hypothetical protein
LFKTLKKLHPVDKFKNLYCQNKGTQKKPDLNYFYKVTGPEVKKKSLTKEFYYQSLPKGDEK